MSIWPYETHEPAIWRTAASAQCIEQTRTRHAHKEQLVDDLEVEGEVGGEHGAEVIAHE